MKIATHPAVRPRDRLLPMPMHVEGSLAVSPDSRFAIVVSRWNSLVTDRLSAAAAQTLRRYGVADDRIVIAKVPGSYELPVVAEQLAASASIHAVICLGAVVQGDTDHDKYINSAVSSGLMSAAQRHRTPISFGVLTCNTMDQALDRAGGKAGNKGEEAALAAIETLSVLQQIGSQL